MSSHCAYHIVADPGCIRCSQLVDSEVEMVGTSDVLAAHLEQDFETDLTPRPPTRTNLIASEPFQQYFVDFPNRHKLIPTPGIDLLCGLYAIQRSIWYQTSLPVPSMKELIHVVYNVLAQIISKTENAMSPEDFERNFSYDNLTQILAEYGRYHFLSLQLGVHFPYGCFPNGVRHKIMNAFRVDERVTMIWVYLDPSSGGHYWGMRHPSFARFGGRFQGYGASYNFMNWFSPEEEDAEDEHLPKVLEIHQEEEDDINGII